MTADEVILKQKISLDKHFCFIFGTKVLIFFCLQMWKGLTDNKKAKR